MASTRTACSQNGKLRAWKDASRIESDFRYMFRVWIISWIFCIDGDSEGNTLKEGHIAIHFSSDINYIDNYIIIDS